MQKEKGTKGAYNVKRKYYLLCFILIFIVQITSASAAEIPVDNLESEAIILMDANTGKVLYQKNENEKMYPASTTKIMTALVALENGDPDDIVHIGNEVYRAPLDASKAGHLPGDEITLRELITALLLPSGADSAYAVASYIAVKTSGDETLSSEGAVKIFADLMNERAKEIGVKKTNFVNPHGYHDEHHYTTAYDLAIITREALKNPIFREIVQLTDYDLNVKGENAREMYLWSRNLLLDSSNSDTYYPYATGVKTGFTDEAGECLVASAAKDGIDLIAVVLNSPKDARWKEVQTLFDYGFENFSFHQVVEKGEIVDKAKVDQYAPKGPSEVEAVAVESYGDLLNNNDIDKIKKSVVWNDTSLVAPIEEGQIIGRVTYSLKNDVLTEIDLAAKQGVEKRTIWDVLFSLKALPYWGGGIAGVLILTFAIRGIQKRKRKRGFRI